MATGTKSKKSKAPVDEDIELEELDEDVEEETDAKAKKESAIEFGVADLCKHLESITGKKYTTRDIRTQIRKMAREDKPRVKREIVAGNRSRYDWAGGLENSEVKRIIAAVTKGEVEDNKKEALAKLKETKAKKGAKEKKKGKKAAKVEEPDDEDDDAIEDIEDDDDDE